ncbi:MAG: Sensor kinase CckA [Verrucomicrobia subdivision 3 bacterium]|nr:Sensor kinase CckA [Limisphaerales bacterium]MCS1414338.1 Sensor kinase CckA [Limisphaerales bacterium]
MLSSILGPLSFITRKNELGTPRNKLLQDTRKDQNFTKKLLTFSSSGKPEKTPSSVEKLIGKAAHLALNGHGTSLKQQQEPHLWRTSLDQDQQVLQNAATNARQAMNDGGTATITTKNETITEHAAPLNLDQGVHISIAIEDTGGGIDQKELTKVFAPVFTTKQQGYGLGLATSHAIIRQQWRTLYRQLNCGKGSTFTL